MSKTALLPTSAIYGNPNQPRKKFDEAALAELGASIKSQGLIQPITVRPDGSGGYMIVAGERRWRAHVLVGIETIPAHVVQISDDDLADQAIIENMQRADITPLEEARAFQARLDTGITVEDLAVRLGMKQAWRISERTQLLKLREEYQDLLDKKQITPSQAYEMSRLSPVGQDIAFRAIKGGNCPSYAALRSVTAELANRESQGFIFGGFSAPTPTGWKPSVVLPPEPTDEDRRLVGSLRFKILRVGDLLEAGFSDNEVVAAKKVDPNEAQTLADKLALMQKHIKQMEMALRQAAVQMEMVA